MACTSPRIVVGGVTISTNDFENARELIANISGDVGDPSYDGYEENIANGNNNKNRSGIQFPPSSQTSPPAGISDLPSDTYNRTPPGLQGNSVVCIPWTGNYQQTISTNFKIEDFTVKALWPHQMQDYPGFSASARVCNLQGLAVNVAEPILAKFGTFIINSGLRNTTSSSNGISQHVTGEAMDIQFTGWTYNRYWDNAKWIAENIPYDQFIFEHSDKTGLAWYHLSFKRSGNRAPSDPNKIMTMYKNRYSPGLLKFG